MPENQEFSEQTLVELREQAEKTFTQLQGQESAVRSLLSTSAQTASHSMAGRLNLAEIETRLHSLGPYSSIWDVAMLWEAAYDAARKTSESAGALGRAGELDSAGIEAELSRQKVYESVAVGIKDWLSQRGNDAEEKRRVKALAGISNDILLATAPQSVKTAALEGFGEGLLGPVKAATDELAPAVDLFVSSGVSDVYDEILQTSQQVEQYVGDEFVAPLWYGTDNPTDEEQEAFNIELASELGLGMPRRKGQGGTRTAEVGFSYSAHAFGGFGAGINIGLANTDRLADMIGITLDKTVSAKNDVAIDVNLTLQSTNAKSLHSLGGWSSFIKEGVSIGNTPEKIGITGGIITAKDYNGLSLDVGLTTSAIPMPWPTTEGGVTHTNVITAGDAVSSLFDAALDVYDAF